jgi:hypothetical protein
MMDAEPHLAHEVVIDGGCFNDYVGFVEEFNRAYLSVFGGRPWDGDDFNDFDDFLESPNGRLTIRWVQSASSRAALGQEAMRAFWLRSLERCEAELPQAGFIHQQLRERIDEGALGHGNTLFDWLVGQLRDNEHVDLVLE